MPTSIIEKEKHFESKLKNKDTNGDILTNTPPIKPYILNTIDNSSSPAGRTLLVN